MKIILNIKHGSFEITFLYVKLVADLFKSIVNMNFLFNEILYIDTCEHNKRKLCLMFS
jgi:hypothetical protein